MVSNASTFINNRTEKNAITQKRVKQILSYVLECYSILSSSGITYSKSQINLDTRIKYEDYYRNSLVDDFLIPNKHLLSSKLSELDQITFGRENGSTYFDHSRNIQNISDDKIDICIQNIGIHDLWNDSNERVYLAIECKRIETLSDTVKYVEDTKKLSDREYNYTRLPYECQLAFLENDKLSHSLISKEINVKYAHSKSGVKTTKVLVLEKLHSMIDSTYISKHQKNFKSKNNMKGFYLYHLFLDYSKLVVV